MANERKAEKRVEKRAEKEGDKPRVFSSGEVARYCQVHFRTVIRWIEKGRLKAYKLPGRGNNRIEEKDFIRFLQENHIPIPEELQDRARPKVLIVDDDSSMAAMIRRVLRQEGYETAIANDGFQAGTMLASVQPALITLDLNMPHMDGFAVLQFIRNQAVYKGLKIIVISALDETHLNKALAAGADACFTKPFKKENLLKTIAELLGS